MTTPTTGWYDPPELDEFERYDPPNPKDNLFPEKPEKRQPDYYCLARHQVKQGENAGKWKYCYRRSGAGTGHVGYGRCSLHGGATPSVENRYAELNNPSIGEKTAKFLHDSQPLNLLPELAAGRAIFEDFIERHDEHQEALLGWYASFDESRRGLHDYPLYHVHAIVRGLHIARKELGEAVWELAPDELLPYLDEGVESFIEDWLNEARSEKTGKTWRKANLRVDKPHKMLDISYGARILKTISDIADRIIKHEQEAFLSAFAVQQLIQMYAESTRKHLTRMLRRLEVKDAAQTEKLLQDIAKDWEAVPVLQDWTPRATAEAERRAERLGS